MANNLIQLKRTSVSGRAANSVTLPNAGELALNMTDGILYSTNGSNIFEIGANNTNVNVSNTLTVVKISANGSTGTSGQVLKSNGSATYWATDSADVGASNQILYRNSSNVLTTSSGLVYDGVSLKVNGNLESIYSNGDEGGEIYLEKPVTNSTLASGVTIDVYQNKLRIFENGGNNRGAYIDITAAANGVGTNLLTGGTGGSGTVTSVDSGSGLTGGPITGAGTLSVLANSGIVANSTGVFVNTAYIGTLSANDASFLGGTAAAGYQTTAGLAANVATLTANNANNLGGVAAASYVNTSGAYTLSGNLTFNGNLTIGTTAGVNANGGYGSAGQVLTSNGTTVYWSTVASGSTNVDAQYTWSNTHSFTNTVSLNAVSANGSLGAAGQVLTSNGSDTYWSTVAASSNAAIAGTSQTFTANGSGNTFQLSNTISNIADIVVSLNGLVQTPTTHYTLSGNTVTFTTAPTNNSIVEVRSFSGSGGVVSAPTMQVFTYSAPSGTWARGASKTGTTSRSSFTVTATVTNHGYTVGDLLYLDATTGTITDQWVQVATTPTTNTFTFSIESAAGSGGNATFYPGIVITANGHGLANGGTVYVNFAQTFDDDYYDVNKADSNTFQVKASTVTSGLSNTGSVTLETLNSSQTWTKPTGCRSVSVRVVGGGASTNTAPAISTSAPAGGGYSEEIIDVSAVSTVTVTVGKGGKTSMGSGTYVLAPPSSVRDGGTSSFGSYLSATGGSVDTPGTGSGGTINVTGTKSVYVVTASYQEAFGGTSAFGAGSYGMGGTAYYNGCTYTVADGKAGVVLVTEYY